jgi:hypothetical protein
MGLIEDELRATFASAVSVTPAVEDAAGRSLRRAHRRHRRRLVAGAAAAVVALGLAGAGVAALGRNHPVMVGLPSPAMSSRAARTPIHPPADVLVGDEIVTTDGRTVSLSGLPLVDAAYATGHGWLVRSWDDTSRLFSLWRIDPAGPRQHLIDGRLVAVSGNASTVAWSLDGSVAVGALTDGGVVSTKQTPGTGGFGPLGFAAGGLLLGRPGTGGAVTTYDMWFPSRGNYTPGPQRSEPIFGPSADGTVLYGLTAGAAPCLAEIDPQTLKPGRTSCPARLGASSRLFASPEGRWLVVADADGLDVYDLTTFWTSPVPLMFWPIAATSLAWSGPSSFVVGSDTGEVTEVGIDPPRTETITVADTPTPVRVVPRLG